MVDVDVIKHVGDIPTGRVMPRYLAPSGSPGCAVDAVSEGDSTVAQVCERSHAEAISPWPQAGEGRNPHEIGMGRHRRMLRYSMGDAPRCERTDPSSGTGNHRCDAHDCRRCVSHVKAKPTRFQSMWVAPRSILKRETQASLGQRFFVVHYAQDL